MKHSELLRAAIPLMKDRPYGRGTIGLCEALSRAVVTTRDQTRVNKIKKRIKKRLYPHSWAKHWLIEQGADAKEMGENIYEPSEKLQTWRREWAEQMAKEYEAAGD